MDDSKERFILRCNHEFHSICLMKHIESSRGRNSSIGCPLCRKEISTYGEQKIIRDLIYSGKIKDIKLCFTDILDINIYDAEWKVTPLHIAAGCGDVSIVKCLVEMGAIVNARAKMQHTPLYMAAMNGYYPIVEYLLSRGADPRLGRYEKTPEMIARECGHNRLADYLSVYSNIYFPLS
jgi:ankyrin repeat protein